MKKKLIVCSLIFFVGFLYANEKSVWVTKEDINLKEFILDEDGVTRIETEKFELKDDYILIIRPIETVENDYICRSSQIYLLKDDSVKLIAENMDGGGNIGNSNKYHFRYEGIDFNNFFCLTRFEGNYEGKFKPFVTHAIFYEDFEVRL